MTHQIYTEKYLIRKGISFCKFVAKERGIEPVGDKRQLFSWVQSIIEWQLHYQPVETVLETATIEYDDSIDGICEGQYCVLSPSGEILRRFRTYAQAERWATSKYSLISPQQEAQQEIEQELEQQISEKISTVAGDEKEDYPERPRGEYTTLEVDFGETIVLFEGQELDTISRDFTLGLWWVGLESFDFYDDAFNCIVSRHQDGCYCEGGDRGSGRLEVTLHGYFEPYGDYGHLYYIDANSHCKVFLGTVFFKDYQGWSLDGNTYQPLEQIAKQLMV